VHDTVLELLRATAATHGPRPAMRSRSGERWETTTWSGYLEAVRQTARGLVALGAGPGHGVTIMAFNRPEWFVANVAAMAAAALPAGIYTSSTPEQCRYIADHAGAAVAIVENRGYLERFLAVRRELPHLRAIVVMEAGDYPDGVVSWAKMLERASSVEESELDRRIAAAGPKDPCTLIYTSGTTGAPKAVTLTHHNLTWIASCATDLLDVTAEDRLISYLPLSHIAEQVVSHYMSMATGACVHFARSLESLPEDLRAVRPHVFLGVPRVWEKMQAGIQAAAATNSPLKRHIGAWARKVGLAAGYAQQVGRRPPLATPLAGRLVFSKVREKLGLDAARLCVVSAAPIAVETLEFFLSLGIPIMEVYGMSECTGPATISVPRAYRTGRAGRALPGTEIRLADDGEVLMRGPHVFAGYYKNEEATREAIDADGWLHSGDVGELDADGYLRITDRKKELIITAGGKNIAPQYLEGRLKQLPAVSQAVAIGDRRPYVVALLTLDPARVASEAEKAGSPARTVGEAALCPVFKSRVEAGVREINESLARYEQVKRFALLSRELTVESDELTPTMKLKRRVVHERYRDVIESLYA
jgi:long-subunit acyl-CoA synthetase (AMP-forming)